MGRQKTWQFCVCYRVSWYHLAMAMIPINCRIDSTLGTKDDQHMDKRRLVEQEKLELQKTKSRSWGVRIGSVSESTVNDVTIFHKSLEPSILSVRCARSWTFFAYTAQVGQPPAYLGLPYIRSPKPVRVHGVVLELRAPSKPRASRPIDDEY